MRSLVEVFGQWQLCRQCRHYLLVRAITWATGTPLKFSHSPWEESPRRDATASEPVGDRLQPRGRADQALMTQGFQELDGGDGRVLQQPPLIADRGQDRLPVGIEEADDEVVGVDGVDPVRAGGRG